MEKAIQFSSAARGLSGIVHIPEPGHAPRPEGIVFLNGWTGYRIGPHRMFVHAARAFAAAGFPCLRFDFRGRGDSEGPTCQATIQSMIEDGREAVSALRAHSGAERIVLLGICSGTKVAIGLAPSAPGITRLALWSAQSLAARFERRKRQRKSIHALRQYAAKLACPATWRKLFRGEVNLALVRDAVSGHERSPESGEQDAERDRRILDRFHEFRGDSLFLFGGSDPEAPPAQALYSAYCREHGMPHRMEVIPGADHSLYSLAWEQQVLALTTQWLLTAGIPTAG